MTVQNILSTFRFRQLNLDGSEDRIYGNYRMNPQRISSSRTYKQHH